MPICYLLVSERVVGMDVCLGVCVGGGWLGWGGGGYEV